MNRVLIVDDSRDNLCLLRMLLQRHGHTVEEAAHGAEALVMARENPPHLIISDVLMPVMDGFTLLRHWKADERFKEIPFIVYTATYTEPKDECFALDLGADAFIVKPADAESFMVRVREVLERDQRNELRAGRPLEADETVVLRHYNEVLVHKLEKKTLDLESAANELRRLNAELERRVRERTAELEGRNRELAEALENVKELSGLIPICSYCKKIREDDQFWVQVEKYMTRHTRATFTHGICPECF